MFLISAAVASSYGCPQYPTSPAARRVGGVALTISCGRLEPDSRLATVPAPVSAKLTALLPFMAFVTLSETQRRARTRLARATTPPARGAFLKVIARSLQFADVERTARPFTRARAYTRSVALVTGASIPVSVKWR